MKFARSIALAATIAASAGHPLAGQDRSSTTLRTASGHPDLQGVWAFLTITPIERPAEFAGKSFLTPEEAKAYQARRLASLNLDTGDRTGLAGPAVNEFWSERGELAMVARRFPTSLVVDPPDGRIPSLTSARQVTLKLRAEVRRQGASAAAFSASERCFRDGRPHLRSTFRSWVGDPRGAWKGDVLVVDSTNFTDLYDRFDGNLHLVERFSRIDRDTLLYEFTVDDPTVYTRPWTVVMPLKRTDDRLFEDACHEGNYALPHILKAVRFEEAGRR